MESMVGAEVQRSNGGCVQLHHHQGNGRPDRVIRNEAGFTLIELTIAVLLSGMVALAIGSMLVTDQRCWDRGSKKLRLIEDASRAMSKMAAETRRGSNKAGSSTEVAAFTDSLHIGPKSFKRDGANNFLFHDGSVTHTFISGTVDSLEYTYPVVRSPGDTLEKTVGIHLALRDGNLRVSLRSTIALRN